MRIVVSGGKGGTGKSMVASSIAIELSKTNKVLLADADVECPNDHLLINAKLKHYSTVYQTLPRWDLKKCSKCGLCFKVCNKDAIIFVKGKFPAFVKRACIGCGACISACPRKAISKARKKIGTIYTGKNYGVTLISGELTLGELASGEIVSELRNRANKFYNRIRATVMILDSAAGVGCPVIASLVGTDYIIAVTEPTPSALHDLKRVLYLARHFKIPCGIVINKHDLETTFCLKIEKYARNNRIPVLGKIPYRQDFVDAMVKMKPITKLNPNYAALFKKIIDNVERTVKL